MKIYNMGSDDVDFGGRLKGADWVVYWYANGGYDGNGTVAWKQGDKYDTENLGHCSCYGPADDVEGSGASMTLEALLEELRPISKTDYNYEYAKKVYNKVMRLTQETRR